MKNILLAALLSLMLSSCGYTMAGFNNEIPVKYYINTVQNDTIDSSLGDIMQEIRKYNQDRISAIISGNGVIPTIQAPKVLINFIPFDAFNRQTFVDLAKADIKMNFPEQRINFDGLLGYQMNDKGINTYCQLYRNGIIEFLSSSNKVFNGSFLL